MNKDEAIQSLLRQIVSEQFPDEVEAFNLAGKEYLEMALSGKQIKCLQKPATVNNEFGDSIIPMLKMVGLIWSTAKVFIEMTKTIREEKAVTETQAAVVERWKRDLIGSGLDPKISEAIATRHADELIRLGKEQG